MTEQDKQLLLKDLCARLPYGVKFEFTRDNVRIAKGIDLGVTDDGKWEYFVTSKGASAVEITEIKPYLRPLSSMTEKEKKELSNYENSVQRTDFFYSHHIDCRFMIEKGLALIAPEDMYKTE